MTLRFEDMPWGKSGQYSTSGAANFSRVYSFFTGFIAAKFLFVFGMLFAFLLALALLLLFAPGFFRFFLRWKFPFRSKIAEIIERMVDAFTVYSRRRGRLLAAVIIGWAVYLCWFLTYYTNNLALGAGLSLGDVLKVGPLTQIATMIPLSIAGIGLREGAFLGLLDAGGVLRNASSEMRSAALLSATMVYFVSVSVNVFGAVIFLLRRTDYRRQIEEMKERSKVE